VPSKPRGKGRPPKSESKYLPTPSATESDDGELQTAIQKSKKRGRKRKLGEPPRTLMKKGLNPWIHSSSEDDDEAVEEEEEEHDLHEDDVEDLTLRSDHEFSPESDMGEDDDASPSRHARTVKRGMHSSSTFTMIRSRSDTTVVLSDSFFRGNKGGQVCRHDVQQVWKR